MAMTNTVQPPGGATAVLAAVDPTTIRMGWMFVPFIVLGSFLMFLVACLVNNIQRQFPVFWWTPQCVGSWWRRRFEPRAQHDIEGAASSSSDISEKDMDGDDGLGEKRVPHLGGRSNAQEMIIVTPDRLILPPGLDLEENTLQILEMLVSRLSEARNALDNREGGCLGEDSNDVLRVVSGASGSTATHVDSNSTFIKAT